MKKFFLSLFSICLCAICVFGFVGCKKAVYSATTTATDKVTSNGGTSLIYNGYLYFINGQLDNDGTNNGGKTVGSVYKVKISEDGTIAEGAKYTKVVDSLVGYSNGSIFIIGDWLYYTCPSAGKNKSGEVLYYKTKFMRYDLVNGTTQELFTTDQNSESETIDFAYYKLNGGLYLIVYETSIKTLTSIKIDKTTKVAFKKTSVTSVLFSQNMGENKLSTQSSSADQFIFYTKAVETYDEIQTGNKVYMLKADGSGERLISQGITLSLLTIRGGKLVFTATFDSNAYIYAFDITNDTQLGDIAVTDGLNYASPNQNGIAKAISNVSYDNVVFIEEEIEGDYKLSVLCYDSDANAIRYFQLKNSTEFVFDVIVYTFNSSTTSISFVDTYSVTSTEDSTEVVRDYIIFTNSNILYKVMYNSSLAEESGENFKQVSPTKLSTSTIEEANGFLTNKLINNYIYVFVEDDDSNVLLHRVNFYTPKELAEMSAETETNDEIVDDEESGTTGDSSSEETDNTDDSSSEETDNTGDTTEEDLEVGEAELIGGTEI